ncbi:MAG TPA: SDR family NAD(P)-dependent oxidoreductase [bacterium]|nr:SDR family NAD(P)-dependent oxidoreductase [bacterium]
MPPTDLTGQVVLISGASAGIGAATARAFAEGGCRLALGARRLDRLDLLAAELQESVAAEVFTHPLDVTDPGSIKDFTEAVHLHYGQVDILVNNAGLAVGVDPVLQATDEAWVAMLDTNVLGVLRLTRAVVPGMVARGRGHVVMLGSIAGRYFYEGGSVYCGTKWALRAITGALRIELNGTPIRISSIDPGMVETEFSVVRLGAQEKADKVYAGMTPLAPADIADCILWACTRPSHVNIDEILVQPVDQAYTVKVARR